MIDAARQAHARNSKSMPQPTSCENLSANVALSATTADASEMISLTRSLTDSCAGALATGATGDEGGGSLAVICPLAGIRKCTVARYPDSCPPACNPLL